MRLSLTTGVVLQILAVIVQLGNTFAEVFPDDSRPIVTAIVALIQAILVKIAYNSNPDGTPNTSAYVKKGKIQ